MALYAAAQTLILDAMVANVASVGLFVGDPAATGVEVSGGSYARSGATFWAVRNNEIIVNTAPIVFSKPTASWGVVTHFKAYNASGGALFSGQLTRSLTLTTGSPALVLGAGTAFFKPI